MNSKVSIVKCAGYDPLLVQEAVQKSVDLIGGIAKFIKPQSKVLVKPNLLMAKEPEYGITTHPEVVRAVIKILKTIDCRVFVGDDPNVRNSQNEKLDEIYERTGMKRVCQEEGVTLVDFAKKRWRGNFPLAAWLDDSDHIVNIPKFKTHNLTVLSGAIKNLFGLVSGTYKAELHKKYFAKDEFAGVLVDVFQEVKPSLTVIDGIVAMEGDGPVMKGKLRNLGLILASADCVALDSILASIMGLEPFDVLTTKEAAARGLGTADINSISVLGEKLQEVNRGPFLLPGTPMKRRLPPQLARIINKFIFFYPSIERKSCLACGICVTACPRKAIRITKDQADIDYRKCVYCFCCSGACPNSAIKVRKSLLAGFLGL
ncbi:MAG: DUF362 domain-containing protein [Candidatus Omnitrophica bacterium]|nr:DUF362 domain-containing protein [Candidatus Omnitrophota bacterium]